MAESTERSFWTGRRTWEIAILTTVCVASFVGTRCLPVTGVLQGMVALGWPASMVGLVIVIVRDNLAHARAAELQERQHLFEMGAASHMAAMIFDKHIAFCEEYLNALFDSLEAIKCAGPDKRMADVATKLWQVRRKYLAWLDEDLDRELIAIENAVRSMAIGSTQMEQTLRADEERMKIFKGIYETFHAFIGMREARDQEGSIASILEQFRALLGVRALINVRNLIVRKFASPSQ